MDKLKRNIRGLDNTEFQALLEWLLLVEKEERKLRETAKKEARDAKVFQILLLRESGALPDPPPAGEWMQGVPYLPGERVIFEGSQFECVAEEPTLEHPTGSNDWHQETTVTIDD